MLEVCFQKPNETVAMFTEDLARLFHRADPNTFCKVWVWTPVRCGELSEKLLWCDFGPYVVLRRLSDITYEVVPAASSTSKCRQQQTDIIHVVCMKPFHSD